VRFRSHDVGDEHDDRHKEKEIGEVSEQEQRLAFAALHNTVITGIEIEFLHASSLAPRRD